MTSKLSKKVLNCVSRLHIKILASTTLRFGSEVLTARILSSSPEEQHKPEENGKGLAFTSLKFGSEALIARILSYSPEEKHEPEENRNQ